MISLRALRPYALAFASGAVFEACSVVWVHRATVGTPLETAIVSAVQAIAQIAGIGEAVREARAAPFFVAGYAIGAYLAMAFG